MARRSAPIAFTIAWLSSDVVQDRRAPAGRVISRTFVIVLAFGAAAYRASQAAWVEAAGLVSLGAGLILLGMGARRPGLKRLAWLAFLLTAVSIGVVLLRRARM